MSRNFQKSLDVFIHVGEMRNHFVMVGKIALSSCVGICYSDTGKIKNLVKNRLHSFYNELKQNKIFNCRLIRNSTEREQGIKKKIDFHKNSGHVDFNIMKFNCTLNFKSQQFNSSHQMLTFLLKFSS